jgi:hypothetical protein
MNFKYHLLLIHPVYACVTELSPYRALFMFLTNFNEFVLLMEKQFAFFCVTIECLNIT